jgi:predicted metalloprotease with PDZ domain
MLKSLLLLLAISFLVQTGFAQNIKEYNYQIEPVIDGNNSHFIVTIDFKQKEQGGLRFLFPQVWGMEQPAEFIQLISVKNAQYKKDNEAISLTFKKNARVRITYKLKNGVSDSIPARGEEYVPTIKPTYFSLFTNSGMLVPEENANFKYSFSIRWKNYPEQYLAKPITSFGNGLKQELKNVSVADFQNGILVGGDYRLYQSINDKKQNTFFAIRGKWSFKDEEMEKLVESTLDQQRKFWDDYSTKNYLMVVSAGGYENEFEQSYTGTGLQNSFAVTAVCNSMTKVESLYYLFHHELMHHWIGNQIKNGLDEELSYWFSEGFTDYFSRKNMYESGLISKEQYISLIDSVLAIHYNNPLASAHNDSIKPNFWGGTYYGKLPYNRGSIFAYYLDGKIQTVSKGKYDLKAVMRIMLSQTKLEKRPFDWQWLQKEILNLVNYDIAADFRRYIVEGELIPIDVLNEALDNQLELKETRVFANGCIMEKNEEGKTFITAVEKNSGAEEAGIQTGDQVLGYSIYGNVFETSELMIKRKGEEMTIPFHAYVLSKPLPQHIK